MGNYLNQPRAEMNEEERLSQEYGLNLSHGELLDSDIQNNTSLLTLIQNYPNRESAWSQLNSLPTYFEYYKLRFQKDINFLERDSTQSKELERYKKELGDKMAYLEKHSDPEIVKKYDEIITKFNSELETIKQNRDVRRIAETVNAIETFLKQIRK